MEGSRSVVGFRRPCSAIEAINNSNSSSKDKGFVVCRGATPRRPGTLHIERRGL